MKRSPPRRQLLVGKQKKKLPVNACLGLFLTTALLGLLLQLHLVFRVAIVKDDDKITTTINSSSSNNSIVAARSPSPHHQRCAILLWGLPRAFESLVLPSLVRHVIQPNARYHCDYFVHYYQLDHEESGRSGQGGDLHPEQVLLLEHHVWKEQKNKHQRTPVVRFAVDQEADFWKKYRPLLDKINNTLDPQGKPLYFPWKARTYQKPTTTDNIIKMWHSIQSVWNLMEQQQQQPNNNVVYTHVAMLRSDVVYMTPIDIYEYGSDVVVVPGFGKHPVSDRIVYGPARAVQIWATQRFAKLESHVQFMYQNNHRGWGLHSERFVQYALFPAMQQVLQEKDDDHNNSIKSQPQKNESHIIEHPTLCFFRARADETVWVSDCDGSPSVALPTIRQHLQRNNNNNNNTLLQGAVEDVLGRSCHGPVTSLTRTVRILNCQQRRR